MFTRSWLYGQCHMTAVQYAPSKREETLFWAPTLCVFLSGLISHFKCLVFFTLPPSLPPSPSFPISPSLPPSVLTELPSDGVRILSGFKCEKAWSWKALPWETRQRRRLILSSRLFRVHPNPSLTIELNRGFLYRKHHSVKATEMNPVSCTM